VWTRRSGLRTLWDMFWWAERMVKTLLGNIDPGTRQFLHTQSRLGGVFLILAATSDLGGLFHLDEAAYELLWRRKDMLLLNMIFAMSQRIELVYELCCISTSDCTNYLRSHLFLSCLPLPRNFRFQVLFDNNLGVFNNMSHQVKNLVWDLFHLIW
jgi:hypothetical protein